MELLVEVAHHRCAARDQRVGHRGAAEVLELVAQRVSPAVVLEESVLGIGRRVVTLLIQIGVAGEHPRARGHHVGLDPTVVRRPAAREGGHLLGVAGARVALQGLRGELEGPVLPPGEDVVLSAIGRADGALGGVAGVVGGPVVLARADADHVLGRARGAHRVVVDASVRIFVLAVVARGERHGHVAVAPDERVGVHAVGRVLTRGGAAPRVGVDSGAARVGLLEEVAQVRRNPRQVVTARYAQELAEERRGRVVLDRLEQQPGRGSRALAQAGGRSVAQGRDRHVRAVPRVHVPRAVVHDRREAEVRGSRPIMDGGDPARRDVGMGRRGRAAADAGVGDADRLGGTVVAGGVRGGGAHDHAAALVVVLLAQHEVLDPRDVPQLCQGFEPLGRRQHDDRPPVAPQDSCARVPNRRRSQGRVASRLELDDVGPLAGAGEARAQLVGGVEEAHPPNARKAPHGQRLRRPHSHLEREIGHVLERLAAGGDDGRLPGRLDRPHELHDVGPAVQGTEGPVAQRGHRVGLVTQRIEGRRLQADRQLSRDASLGDGGRQPDAEGHDRYRRQESYLAHPSPPGLGPASSGCGARRAGLCGRSEGGGCALRHTANSPSG